MMNDIPELNDIFYVLLDLIDSKKNLDRFNLYDELKLEFPNITEETLIPNVDFCLAKLIEAELIKKVGEYHQITGKGKKILLSDSNELGLDEINFYAAHDENFYGLPPKGLKPKTFANKILNNYVKEYAAYAMVFFCIGLLIRYFSKSLDKGIDATIGATIEKATGANEAELFEKELDKSFDKVIKEPLR
jgi:hypothetical protein